MEQVAPPASARLREAPLGGASARQRSKRPLRDRESFRVWSLGAETIYDSSQFLRGDESNQLEELDGYWLVNLRASYRWQHVELYARVDNVFHEEYENFGLLGEDPTEVLPDLADERPVFVGAGAPRAGWLGFRLSL